MLAENWYGMLATEIFLPFLVRFVSVVDNFSNKMIYRSNSKRMEIFVWPKMRGKCGINSRITSQISGFSNKWHVFV